MAPPLAFQHRSNVYLSIAILVFIAVEGLINNSECNFLPKSQEYSFLYLFF